MKLVRDFFYQPCTFTLFGKVTYRSGKKEKTLFQDHVYSPDFLIIWEPEYTKFKDEFKVPFGDEENMVYVDVKGSFNRN